MRNYLAIGGCPRSGTTALTDFLNMDDRIFIGREFRIFESWDSHILKLGGVIDDRFKKGGKRLDKINRHGIKSPAEDMTGSQYMDYVESVKKFEVYGDKMPRRYVINAENLAERFPSMKFIFCVRDGRDVIASQIRLWNKGVKKGFTFSNVSEAQSMWIGVNNRVFRLLSYFPRRIYVAKYEELVMHPEMAAIEIGRFLNLGVIDIAGHNYHPVHLGAWKEELPGMEEHLNDEFKHTMKKWGYM